MRHAVLAVRHPGSGAVRSEVLVKRELVAVLHGVIFQNETAAAEIERARQAIRTRKRPEIAEIAIIGFRQIIEQNGIKAIVVRPLIVGVLGIDIAGISGRIRAAVDVAVEKATGRITIGDGITCADHDGRRGCI